MENSMPANLGGSAAIKPDPICTMQVWTNRKLNCLEHSRKYDHGWSYMKPKVLDVDPLCITAGLSPHSEKPKIFKVVNLIDELPKSAFVDRTAKMLEEAEDFNIENIWRDQQRSKQGHIVGPQFFKHRAVAMHLPGKRQEKVLEQSRLLGQQRVPFIVKKPEGFTTPITLHTFSHSGKSGDRIESTPAAISPVRCPTNFNFGFSF